MEKNKKNGLNSLSKKTATVFGAAIAALTTVDANANVIQSSD